MSEAIPQAAEIQAGGDLDSDLAEELIRRAIAIDDNEKRLEKVTLAEIKGTLADLGIPAKTVERAAAEVRQEITKATEGVGLWMEWELTAVFSAAFASPGVVFVRLGLLDVTDPLAWLMIAMGGLWVLLVFGVFMDLTYELWKERRKQRDG
jgi:hypothetical protein